MDDLVSSWVLGLFLCFCQLVSTVEKSGTEKQARNYDSGKLHLKTSWDLQTNKKSGLHVPF